jgi:flagellar protein FlaF
MFMQAYQDVADDEQDAARENERIAFEQIIKLMIQSDAETGNHPLRVKAIHDTSQLWSHLLNDLASAENANPAELKASIISIGIFILKHLERMRADRSLIFSPIIEISETIRKGLR